MSPVLAAADGIWPLVLGAIFLLFKWLGSATSDDSKKPPAAPGSRPTSAKRDSAEEEAERARRFMEALGLPPTAAPPAPRRPPPESPPLRPPSESASLRPPPQPAQKAMSKKQRRKLQAAQEAAARGETPSLDSLPKPSQRVENIHLGALQTPVYQEMRTVAGEVSAIPFEQHGKDGMGSPSEAGRDTRRQVTDSLRALLRSRDTIRSAFVLREILGPPLGLQRPNRGSNFPSP